jgi:hypothetical protein
MPKLDTHLHNLIAQWYDAKTDDERHRLQREGQKHLVDKGVSSARESNLHWTMLIDLMEAP